MRWRAVAGWSGLIIAVVVWTAAAVAGVGIGVFAAADTRCGPAVADPQIDMRGGWIVIGTLIVWSMPFLLCSLFFRNRWAVAPTAAAAVVALVTAAAVFTHPVAFCW